MRLNLLTILFLVLVSCHLEDSIEVDGDEAQVRIEILDPELNKLVKALVQYTDSTGTTATLADSDEDGFILLGGLPTGTYHLLVKQAGYLGSRQSVTVETAKDSIRPQLQRLSVILLPLKHELDGMIFQKSTGGFISPLSGGKIIFRLQDSLASPKSFEGFSDSAGLYFLDSLPALPGLLEYYRTSTGAEPVRIDTLPLSRLILAGPLPDVVLPPDSISSSTPIVLALPHDTLTPRDTLLFTFNQPADGGSVNLSVRLVNQPDNRTLLTPWTLGTNGKSLRATLSDSAGWKPGMVYQYSLAIKNTLGEFFYIPGQVGKPIEGFFQVKKKGIDSSTFIYPAGFRLAYFSSGISAQFDSVGILTSPLADSTSNMARLKWNKPKPGSKLVLVDSFVVFIKDSKQFTDWTTWRSFPSAVDSATLFFSDLYATRSFPSPNKPKFPLLQTADSAFQLRIIPKHGSTVFFDSARTLPTIYQQMGPAIYVTYTNTDSLAYGPGRQLDTFNVRFHLDAVIDSLAAVFDTAKFKPIIVTSYTQKQGDKFTWDWQTTSTGRVTYDVADGGALHFSTVGLELSGGVLVGVPASMPLWFRDRNKKVEIR